MKTCVELQGRRFLVESQQGSPTLVDGVTYAVDWVETEPGTFSLLWTDEAGKTRSFQCTAGDSTVVIDGERLEYSIHDPRSLRSSNGAAGNGTGPRTLKAPMPGRIVRVLVAPGDHVEAGQGCVVIEAMKMQNELKAPRAGVIRKLQAHMGETVSAGAVLLVVE